MYGMNAHPQPLASPHGRLYHGTFTSPPSSADATDAALVTDTDAPLASDTDDVLAPDTDAALDAPDKPDRNARDRNAGQGCSACGPRRPSKVGSLGRGPVPNKGVL